MKGLQILFILGLLVTFASGCATVEGGENHGDYESTKEMLVDLLKTDEGKAAVREILTDEEVRQDIVMEQTFVQSTIQDTLVSPEGKAFWQETMKDPEFARALAESMRQEHEELLRRMMKDPEYQAVLLELWQDPEMDDNISELLRSKEHKQQIMNVMTEAFESPFFLAKLHDILTEVSAERLEQEAADQEQQEQQEQEQEDQQGEEGEQQQEQQQEGEEEPQ
ncbi:spore germination lipoprotein GerD [Thalassorhabdus alkalitolerans]|uniref:Spore germination lipoprotein GerD n=1 Tax=Thalassorhabdus alkalitolerans TaxID=2282697 RepID=A0ABW0YQZ3_9BACI